MKVRTCVSPKGGFLYGVHRPRFHVANFRETDRITNLCASPDGTVWKNHANFPPGAVDAPDSDWVFEIPNPFPFRGTTYISRTWADGTSADPAMIRLPTPPPVSITGLVRQWTGKGILSPDNSKAILESLPEPLLLAAATCSTDPEDLVQLAETCCEFDRDAGSAMPRGLICRKGDNGPKPLIHRPLLFEAVANNPALPDRYKQIMVLRPGAQGNSGIVGDWSSGDRTRVFEYLRQNSYIPWGHYAANMADDAVRYSAADITMADMTGMRHLYYQRTVVRVAELLGISVPFRRRALTIDELEALRLQVLEAVRKKDTPLSFNRTLWGWNFGFDYAPSGYRLHASHQQVHQQYAMVPAWFSSGNSPVPDFTPYSCGDLVENMVDTYRAYTGSDFFRDYLRAIRGNRRFPESAGTGDSLVVYEDRHVLLFVPKAQTSQWELQLMPLSPIGNVLEADTAQRNALDRGLLVATRILAGLGARMVTAIEFSKRFDAGDTGQHLLYSLLPRLPESPGAFSEAQLRWINGHYPEDFACACRLRLPEVKELLPDIAMKGEGPGFPGADHVPGG